MKRLDVGAEEFGVRVLALGELHEHLVHVEAREERLARQGCERPHPFGLDEDLPFIPSGPGEPEGREGDEETAQGRGLTLRALGDQKDAPVTE